MADIPNVSSNHKHCHPGGAEFSVIHVVSKSAITFGRMISSGIWPSFRSVSLSNLL